MSRYKLKTYDPNISAVIGWDNPLETFFCNVERINPDADEDDDDYAETLVSEGGRPKQHPHLGFILPKLASYATVPPATIQKLAADRAATVPPSQLQRRMIALVEGVHVQDATLDLLERSADAAYDLPGNEYEALHGPATEAEVAGMQLRIRALLDEKRANRPPS